MNLFNEKIINLLNKGGFSNYYEKIISKKESDRFYELLLKNIFWKNDEAVIYGKRITTKRKVAGYGDFDYSYSNTSKQTLPWTIELLDLRKKIEEIIDIRFNSCLLNLYNNSNEGV
jgi:alkylated DNA repair dioxygenase AlkB